ncbi:F0F1 ATP synthase subunit B [Gryllotalpicola ginsengisoli]|uniref:F0F1 ATP synthase subunit B n=1 Tax=Gryllotalpicola ginsengisoli TaxID=444608 RepID=UPI0003B7970E|nr:F0F1 ATP synthase subunit B [Gryllotalpicola ginsengisoli]
MTHAVVAAEESINPLIPAPSDLVWATLCFLVVLAFFVWKFIPSFLKMLDDRAAAIEGNIAKADEAQNKAEALLEQYTAQLADARSEAARIKEQAREEGKRIIAEQREQAAAEAARVTAAAQAQIEMERKQAAAQLRSEVGSLAIDLASGVIGESLKDDAKAAGVVDRFLADLEASETGKAGAQA